MADLVKYIDYFQINVLYLITVCYRHVETDKRTNSKTQNADKQTVQTHMKHRHANRTDAHNTEAKQHRQNNTGKQTGQTQT